MHRSDTIDSDAIERLYLDFDSFFATAEQHFNAALRGRPVGVVPLDSPNTGCIAISREAKDCGLPGNATVKEARALIPDMIFVVARHDVYVRLHHRIVKTIEHCLPIAHVRSIDELVCHLLPSQAAEGHALAGRIKRALAEQFSEVLTCSIGMARTELIAKVAAELHKPDGFCLIRQAELPAALRRLPLRKIPGISDGLGRRLGAANVTSFEELWKLGPKQCRAIWHNIEGERFWKELHGIHAERAPTVKRMFGHSRMLPPDWRGSSRIATCARQLCLSAGRRLRRTDLLATKLTLGFRGGDARQNTGSAKVDTRWTQELPIAPARDDYAFLHGLGQALTRAEKTLAFRPRSESVTLHGLVEGGSTTGDLFDNHGVEAEGETPEEQRRKREELSDLMDTMRRRFGPHSVTLGPREELPGGYVGAKIAFGRIPELTDFNGEPVPDEQTHFCTRLD